MKYVKYKSFKAYVNQWKGIRLLKMAIKIYLLRNTWIFQGVWSCVCSKKIIVSGAGVWATRHCLHISICGQSSFGCVLCWFFLSLVMLWVFKWNFKSLVNVSNAVNFIHRCLHLHGQYRLVSTVTLFSLFFHIMYNLMHEKLFFPSFCV